MNPAFQAEQSVLGAVFMRNSRLSEVAEVITPADFGDVRHRLIYASMLTLEVRGEAIDAVTLASALEANGGAKDSGGLKYLLDLTVCVATSVNVVGHARVVLAASKRRALHKAVASCAAALADPSVPVDVTVGELEAAMSAIIYDQEKSMRGVNTPEAVDILVSTLQALSTSDDAPYVSTGLAILDDAMNGGIYRKSKQYIIAAPTGVGKTALAHYLATEVSYATQDTVLYFSVEVPAEDLQVRAISKLSSVPGSLLARPEYTTEHQQDLIQQALARTRAMKRDGVVVFYCPGFTAEDVMRKTREYQRKGTVAMVVCDYIQTMGTVKSFRQEGDRIKHISDRLMSVAASCNVPVITLSQMTKEIDKRPGHEPIVGDMMYGSGLANNADMIMFLDRPAYWDMEQGQRHTGDEQVNIWIRKNRGGAIGRMPLMHNPANGRFWDDTDEGRRRKWLPR